MTSAKLAAISESAFSHTSSRLYCVPKAFSLRQLFLAAFFNMYKLHSSLSPDLQKNNWKLTKQIRLVNEKPNALTNDEQIKMERVKSIFSE